MQQPFTQLTPGMMFHIYNRGNNGENIFKEQRNYAYFLMLYQKHVVPFVETHAYNLLYNHFHLMVQIKEQYWDGKTWVANSAEKTSKAFSNCFNAYAQGINKANGRTGLLFETPFRRIEISDAAHYTWLIYYIHTNAQRHGLVKDFRQWLPSSYHAMVQHGLVFLEREKVLGWFGGLTGFIKYHEQIDLVNDFVLEDFMELV